VVDLYDHEGLNILCCFFFLNTTKKKGEILDNALVINFPNPRSFTGEHILELHVRELLHRCFLSLLKKTFLPPKTHGSNAVQEAMARTLGSFNNVRMAAPGEFTRRALENGKLNLTQVEGLSDLINAETRNQRIQSLRQLRGDLGELYDGWRTSLIQYLGLLAFLYIFIFFVFLALFKSSQNNISLCRSSD
jgi:tRNA modification GTPase